MGKIGIAQETLDRLRDLLTHIVSEIVDSPEEVSVSVVPASYTVLVELHTSSRDVGQVIGRQGSVVSGLRSILASFGGKHRIRVDLDYVTEQRNREERR